MKTARDAETTQQLIFREIARRREVSVPTLGQVLGLKPSTLAAKVRAPQQKGWLYSKLAGRELVSIPPLGMWSGSTWREQSSFRPGRSLR